MIKAVLFDFGQTLADSAEGFRLAEKNAELKLFEDLGLDNWENFLTIYREFRLEYQRKSNFSRMELWHGITQHFGSTPDISYLSSLEEEYWETVNLKTRLFPETEAVLDQISSSYRLAMITNTQGQVSSGEHRLNLFPQLEGIFETIILAGEGDIPAKPDPEPFNLCLDRLHLRPFEAVYVGDDLRIDIFGADDAGIQPIWLKHNSIKRNWPRLETTAPVITDLEQLIPRLLQICKF